MPNVLLVSDFKKRSGEMKAVMGQKWLGHRSREHIVGIHARGYWPGPRAYTRDSQGCGCTYHRQTSEGIRSLQGREEAGGTWTSLAG